LPPLSPGSNSRTVAFDGPIQSHKAIDTLRRRASHWGGMATRVVRQRIVEPETIQKTALQDINGNPTFPTFPTFLALLAYCR